MAMTAAALLLTTGVMAGGSQRAAAGTPRSAAATPPPVTAQAWLGAGDTVNFSTTSAVYGTLEFGDGTETFVVGAGGVTHTYPAPGTYTATYLNGLGGPNETLLVTAGEDYTVRDGNGGYSFPVRVYQGTIPARGVVKISVAALSDGRATGYSSAMTDVLISGPRKAGTIAVYPDGAAQRAATATAFRAGQSASGTALATVGADGRVDFANHSAAQVRITIYSTGVEVADPTKLGGFVYEPVRSVRVLAPKRVVAEGSTGLRVAGVDGINAKLAAVALDVTVSGTRAGSLVIGPDLYSMNDLDWAAGQRVTKLEILPLEDRQDIGIGNDSAGSAVISATVVGYFPWGPVDEGAAFLPVGPDTVEKVTIGARHTMQVKISGRYGLPATGVDAALVSLTAAGAAKAGTIEGWPAGTARPNSPVLSYSARATAVGAAQIAVSSSGSFNLYNTGTRSVTVTITLTGAYYAG